MLTVVISANDAPLYTKEIVGKPCMAYYDKEQQVAKELGINIKHVFKGCKVERGGKSSESTQNQAANKYYSLKLGKNWKAQLKEETTKRMKQ